MAQDPDASAAWREQRRAAADAQASAMDRRKAAETERARRIVADFVAAAQEHGLAPQPLVARAYSGRGEYRTGLLGWYVRRNRTLAVGVDGEFYILTVPGGLRARLRGAVPPPADPPLVVGAGGRDGESIPLQELLQLRLDAGDDWP
jgi:hypothetical protein